jgi:hypothetical protein
MLDTKVILALALLLGSAMSSLNEAPNKQDKAGGIPPPPHTTGAGNFQ